MLILQHTHTLKHFSYTRLLNAVLPPHITPHFILAHTHTHRQPSAVIVHEKWALDHCHACIHNVVEDQQGEGPQANLVVDTSASSSEYTTVRVR